MSSYPIRDWRQPCAGESASGASPTLEDALRLAAQERPFRASTSARWTYGTMASPAGAAPPPPVLSGLRLSPDERCRRRRLSVSGGDRFSIDDLRNARRLLLRGETHIGGPTPSADNPYLVGRLWILSEDHEFILAMTAGDFNGVTVECDDGDGGSYTYSDNNFVRVSLDQQPFDDANSLSGTAEFMGTHGGRTTLDHYEWDLTGGSTSPPPNQSVNSTRPPHPSNLRREVQNRTAVYGVMPHGSRYSRARSSCPCSPPRTTRSRATRTSRSGCRTGRTGSNRSLTRPAR